MKDKTRDPLGNAPLVSVVVLTYRQFEFLYETLETILAQDYPNVELLLSDDGSEHFPREQIQAWLQDRLPETIPVRIRQNHTNLGVAAHSNAAAADTSGAFIKFLTPGDGFAHPQALTQLVQFARQCQSNVIISPSLVCKGDFSNVCYEFPSARRVRVLRSKTPAELFSVVSATNIICAVGALYSRAFFDEGGFNTAYRNLDDWPTWLTIYRRGESLPCMETPTVFYRIGGMSSVHGTAFDSELLKEDLLYCIEHEILPYSKRLTWLARMSAGYRHSTLQETRSLRSRIVYFPMDCYCWLKKIVKSLVIGRRG